MRPGILMLLLLASLPAFAQEDNRLDVSVSLGVALPGVLQAAWEEGFPAASTVSFRSQFSPAVKLELDWFPLPRLGPTLALHYAALLLPREVDLGFWDGRQHVLPKADIHFTEVEAGIRYRYPLLPALTLEPAVSLGYCHTFSGSPDARNNGFILDLVVEAKRRVGRGHLLACLGLMSQLYGGVEGIAWVRSYPVVYCCLGAGL